MNIALIGYGKMGRSIAQLIADNHATTHQVACRIGTVPNNDLDVCTWDSLCHTAHDQLNGIDVAIEFSRPEAALDNLSRCLHWGVPVVCGTTGWLQHLPYLSKLCQQQQGALLYAANFSLSVNILLALNRQLAALMQRFGANYALEINETHHTQKLDAPSGTAIALAEGIMAANPHKKIWVNAASDNYTEIPIIAHRIADVKGEHSITYRSDIDQLQLHHIAYSRQGFAQGAVAAAEWLQGKQGVFTMDDILKIN